MLWAAALLPLLLPHSLHAAGYPDRFVWVFGWGLQKDKDLVEITNLLTKAAASGINGAVLSAGLDNLSRQSPDFFRRLETLQQACEANRLELIPSVFSVGYGAGALAQDRQLAEGLPVIDAPFAVTNGQARFVPDSSVGMVNGGFEQFKGNQFSGFGFHDQPGVISLVDTQVVHSGHASIRLEHFDADKYGHGRVMQKIKVDPHRCYRMSLWAKTEALQPTSSFQIMFWPATVPSRRAALNSPPRAIGAN